MALPGSNIAARQQLIFIAQDIINEKLDFSDKFFDNMNDFDYGIVFNLAQYKFGNLGWGDYGKDFVPPIKKKKMDLYSDEFSDNFWTRQPGPVIDCSKCKQPLAVLPRIRVARAQMTSHHAEEGGSLATYLSW